MRHGAIAAIGENRIDGGHIDHFHIACAQRQRDRIGERRRNAHGFGCFENFHAAQFGEIPLMGVAALPVSLADLHREADRCRVQGFLQGNDHRHLASRCAAVILRAPIAEANARCIDNGRGFKLVRHQCGQIDDRLEG